METPPRRSVTYFRTMSGFEDLFSSKRDLVLKALEEARERGTLEWVRPLLEAFRDRPEEDIRQEIAAMLGALKISDAAAVLSDALDDPEFEAHKADIIGFLWSCGFQSEDDLRAVVECAVEGDFRCAMEALTWVEELERVLDEQALLDALLAVRGAMEDTDKSDPRSALFESMHQSLQRLERAQ